MNGERAVPAQADKLEVASFLAEHPKLGEVDVGARRRPPRLAMFRTRSHEVLVQDCSAQVDAVGVRREMPHKGAGHGLWTLLLRSSGGVQALEHEVLGGADHLVDARRTGRPALHRIRHLQIRDCARAPHRVA